MGASAFVPGETDDAGPFELLVNAAPVTDQPLGQAKGVLAALGRGVGGGRGGVAGRGLGRGPTR